MINRDAARDERQRLKDEVKTIERKPTAAGIRRLMVIMGNPRSSEAVQLEAAQAVLNIGWGRPRMKRGRE